MALCTNGSTTDTGPFPIAVKKNRFLAEGKHFGRVDIDPMYGGNPPSIAKPITWRTCESFMNALSPHGRRPFSQPCRDFVHTRPSDLFGSR